MSDIIKGLRKKIGKFYFNLKPEFVINKGRMLPARHLRLCGDFYKDDENFIQTARKDAQFITREFKLGANSKVLDLGCGYGRLAFGLHDVCPQLGNYYGIDINAKSVAWCKKYIEANFPNYKFYDSNILNRRYNPKGDQSSEVVLPIEDEQLDLIYLYSVFSHMLVDDISKYLFEFRRILKKDGSIFLTAFVEEDVEDMAENPSGYLRESWYGPLHCVRYNRKFLENEFDEKGFNVHDFRHGVEMHGQSRYILTVK